MKKTQRVSASKRGFVYIFSNPAHKKGLLKIGHTTKTPEERAKQLYDTSSPKEFDILYKMEFKDSFKAEKQIHLLLEKYRYNKKREFFTCSRRRAIKSINSADGRIGVLNNNNNNYALEVFIFLSTFFLTLLLLFLWF